MLLINENLKEKDVCMRKPRLHMKRSSGFVKDLWTAMKNCEYILPYMGEDILSKLLIYDFLFIKSFFNKINLPKNK